MYIDLMAATYTSVKFDLMTATYRSVKFDICVSQPLVAYQIVLYKTAKRIIRINTRDSEAVIHEFPDYIERRVGCIARFHWTKKPSTRS